MEKMTEIQEVAEAIKLKYGQLWPVTREMAAYIAINEAGDQGHTIVAGLVHELLMLNPVTPVAEATANLLVRLDQAYQNLDRLPGDFDTEMDTLSDAELLLRRIHQCLKELDSETCQIIAEMMTAEGFLIGEVPTVPAGATHRDQDGSYWAIQEDETNAGEIWAEDHWQVSGFSDSWFNQMEEL